MSDKIEVTKEETKAEVAPVEETIAEIRKGANPKKTFTYELIPPNDPRVRVPVAPFKDHLLEEYGIKDRKELVSGMFELMHRYGGIGLSAIQVGLPFNMFVAGDHQSIEKGLKLAMFNPVIMTSSDEKVLMKEDDLTFPFFLLILVDLVNVTMKYEDENGDLKEAQLDGMMSRVCQHEYDHGSILMVQKVSKMKLDMAYKKA